MDSEIKKLVEKVDAALNEIPEIIAESFESIHTELAQTDEILEKELAEKQNMLKHKKHILESLEAEMQLLQSSPQKFSEVHFSPKASWNEDQQELILLYHKISNISWNYGDSHISGTINNQFFKFSSDSPANFYSVNQLWTLIEKLNN